MHPTPEASDVATPLLSILTTTGWPCSLFPLIGIVNRYYEIQNNPAHTYRKIATTRGEADKGVIHLKS